MKNKNGIGNINTYNFSGLIGDIGENASVSVDFVNDSYIASSDSYSDITSASDIGLICGTMDRGSRINVTTSGTNIYYDVSSSESGNAGGLVGTMHDS